MKFEVAFPTFPAGSVAVAVIPMKPGGSFVKSNSNFP